MDIRSEEEDSAPIKGFNWSKSAIRVKTVHRITTVPLDNRTELEEVLTPLSSKFFTTGASTSYDTLQAVDQSLKSPPVDLVLRGDSSDNRASLDTSTSTTKCCRLFFSKSLIDEFPYDPDVACDVACVQNAVPSTTPPDEMDRRTSQNTPTRAVGCSRFYSANPRIEQSPFEPINAWVQNLIQFTSPSHPSLAPTCIQSVTVYREDTLPRTIYTPAQTYKGAAAVIKTRTEPVDRPTKSQSPEPTEPPSKKRALEAAPDSGST